MRWTVSTARPARRRLTFLVAGAVLVGTAGIGSPSASAASTGEASIDLTKTVTSANFTPRLGLSLTRDRDHALPADRIGYTATVSNVGATLHMGGTFKAASSAEITGTIQDWYDDVEYYSRDSKAWVPIASVQHTAVGWTPAVDAPATATPLDVTTTGGATSGVSYSSGSDQVLGAQIDAKATATWTYDASASLTQEQVALLSDSARAGGLRNVVHMELSPRSAKLGQPYTYRRELTNPFTGASSAVTDTAVTFTLPDQSTVSVTSADEPALAGLSNGQSASVTASYRVPVADARGDAETDEAYASRLDALDGRDLAASAKASGRFSGSDVTASAGPVSSTERLPIVEITKSGPATAEAGTSATYDLALHNAGTATASDLAVTDQRPAAPDPTVRDVPDVMAPGDDAHAHTSYDIPETQPSGALTDVGRVEWDDANGNIYGPLSSSYQTDVTDSMSGSTLSLAPQHASGLVGSERTLTATLTNRAGDPVSGATVGFDVTGANQAHGQDVTDVNGRATFTYTGTASGDDVAQASTTRGSTTLQSNSASISWLVTIQPVAVGTVTGRFFAESGTVQTFVAKPADTPVFGQKFPNIAFDPPAGSVPHDLSGVNPTTRPFTDVTTDVLGNADGTIVAHGNGALAGVATMSNFNAVFTSGFTVAQAGDVSFTLAYDDDVVLGVGGGATRVSGVYEQPPTTGTTAFEGYPVVAADNRGLTRSAPVTETITIHFPGAGTYPFELDYAEGHGNPLSLVLGVGKVVQDSSPLSVYVGYADGLRAGGSAFPFPWNGSSNLVFDGCSGCTFDGGALRFDNTGDTPIHLDKVTVDIGSHVSDLWGNLNRDVPAHGTLVMTQTTSGENFDTSDYPSITCRPDGLTPQIHVTIDGTTTTYADSDQILNTKGFDPANCGGGNESHPWSRIAGGDTTVVDHPLPPAALLRISAAGQSGGDLTGGDQVGNEVGSSQEIAVSAMDASGQPVSDLDVDLLVDGVNGQHVHGTTDDTGTLDLSYVGTHTGQDTLQASGFVSGLRTFSNEVAVTWDQPAGTVTDPSDPTQTLPADAPAITGTAPVDGARVTTPVPVKADIAPPDGSTLTSWKVTYQDTDGGQETVLASGDGTPPATLATLDPTALPNGAYVVRITATSSNGGIQTQQISVLVDGNLKLGRFTRSYQDLSVPVDGFTMQVQRTYDSTDKRVGDFGVGWHVSVGNLSVRANRTLGAGGWSQYASSCFFSLCVMGLRTSAPHYVAVRYPDGHQETFDFTPTGGTNVFNDGTAAFTARAGTGTTSTLTAEGDQSLFVAGDGNLYSGISGTGGLYDPHRFDLTTGDGRVIVLDTRTGLVGITDPQGRTLSVDADGVHSSSGQSITFTRDSEGRITDVQGPDATQHVHYAYADGDLSTVTDPDGHTVDYGYQTGHYLHTVTGPDGALVATIDYTDGRLSSITDAEGHTSSVDVDVDAQTQTVQDATGRLSTTSTYDDLGDVLTQVRTFGGKSLTTSFTYDGAGRQLTETDPLGHTWTTKYDADGNLHTFTNPDQKTWTYDWKSPNHLATLTAPSGDVVASYTYNTHSQPLTEVGADGRTSSFTYVNGRLDTMTDAGGRSFRYSYDPAGQVAGTTDDAGRTTTFVRNAAGQITSSTDANGDTTSFTYDNAGHLTTRTDANGHTSTWAYDAYGRLHTVTDPSGAARTYDYNDVGRLSQITDRNDKVITYGYDADGRQTRITLPSGDENAYTYDPLGRVETASSPDAVLRYTYDDGSRMTSERVIGAGPVSGLDVTTSWTYSDSGLATSMTSLDGTTGYRYDDQQRLRTVTDQDGHDITIGYDATSHPDSVQRPNGVDDTLTWNASGDLTGITSAGPGGATLAEALYDPAPATGWRQSETTLGGASSLAHDDTGRLTQVDNSADGTTQHYAYDPAGNLTAWPGTSQGQATIDATDRLTSDGTYDYTYDGEGRRLTRTDRGSGSTDSYTWNALGELRSVTGGGHTSSYAYDAIGRRIQTDVDGTITRTVYDGNAAHLQLDDSNHVVLATTAAGQVGAPLEIRRNGTTLYPLTDGHGSVTTLTDASGAVTGRYTYDQYGRPSADNPSLGLATYTGQPYDKATGLYLFGSRYYDPGTGRFLSEDPLPLGNAYAYANGNPANQSDPGGAEAAQYGIFINVEGETVQIGLEELGSSVALEFVEALQASIDAMLEDDLAALMDEVLSEAENGAYEGASNYGLKAKFIGKLVHEVVARDLAGFEDFVYNPTNGVDFINEGENVYIELTTKTQIAAKWAKGGDYLKSIVVTYPWPGFP